MNGDDRFESRMARLLAASRANANPAVLARARARLAAEAAAPAWLAWFARPSALVTACALFVAALAGTIWWSPPATSTSGSDTTLVASLLGDDGNYGLPSSVTTAPRVDAADSGGVTP